MRGGPDPLRGDPPHRYSRARPGGAGHVTEPALWEGISQGQQRGAPGREPGLDTPPSPPAWGQGLAPECSPAACLSSPCLNGGSCHLIVATGTTVCACPPDYAGRLCNIGESPSLRALCAPCPAAQAHRTPTAHSARPALLRGDWHRVPRRGQHGGLGPQLPGLELRPALPGAARGLRGCRGPPGPGPSRLLPVSTVPTALTPLLGRLLRECRLGPGLRTTCRSRGFWGGQEPPTPPAGVPISPLASEGP